MSERKKCATCGGTGFVAKVSPGSVRSPGLSEKEIMMAVWSLVSQKISISVVATDSCGQIAVMSVPFDLLGKAEDIP